MTETTDVEALASLIQSHAAAGRVIEKKDGTDIILVPEGFRPHASEPTWPELQRIKQSVSLFDEPSFSRYVKDFKGVGTTRLFALPSFIGDKPTVTAVFDYHDAQKGADHLAHQAVYRMRHSEEWEAWTKISGESLSQQEFAEFLEERQRDITEPTAAEILDLVRNFKASRKVEFNSVIHEDSGDVKIGYDEDTQVASGSKQVGVPNRIRLGIPVFFQGPLYDVGVWLRFRIGGAGRVTFILKLDRPDYVEAAAFDSVLKDIETATELRADIGRL